MPDPYAPRGPRRTTRTRPAMDLDVFLGRLAAIGATADELAAAAEHWDPTDPEQQAIYQANDVVLAQEVRRVRQEYAEATGTEQVPAPKPEPQVVLGLSNIGLPDPSEVPDKPVQAVLDWVGNDTDRAQVALAVELAKPEGEHRKTVVEPLQAQLAAG